jgi:hypothetical protein
VKALSVIVRAKLAKQMSKVPLAEDDELVEALGAYRLHEPLRVRGAVRSVRGNRHTFDAAGLEQCPPCFRK